MSGGQYSMHNEKCWWCTTCEQNVDILIAHEVGIFCRQCGTKIETPKERLLTGRVFFETEDGSDEDSIVNRMVNK